MSTKRADRGLVSASELAQIGYCERATHFDWRHGAQRTPEQLQAQDRGNAAHQRFYRDSIAVARASERKGKCFIATLALGEGAATTALRAFRDLYLRRTPGGRWLIGHSRKSFMKALAAEPDDRDGPTLAMSALLAQTGVHILRVHEVARHKALLDSLCM